MKIVLAKNAGFCFGVRRAVEMAEEMAAHGGGHSLGPVIHNRHVVESLAGRGVKAVASLDEVDGGPILLPSHGVSPEIIETAGQKGLAVYDATCPLVRRAQEAARHLAEKGYTVVVVGDPAHTEVQSIIAWAGGKVVVVGGPDDVRDLPPMDRVGVLSQTTQPAEKLEGVVAALRERAREVWVEPTICRVTLDRQAEARELARLSDVVLVVGGRQSANTRQLAEIGRVEGARTHHLESAAEIEPGWFSGAKAVAILAGASTPDWITEEVVAMMKELDEGKEPGTEEETKSTEPAEPINAAAPAEPIDAAAPAEPIDAAAPAEPIDAAAPAEPEDAGKDHVEPEQAGAVAPETESMTEGQSEMEKAIRTLKNGELVRGKVVSVSDEGVMVDVGYKSEGIVPLSEMGLKDNQTPADVVRVGDEINVVVKNVEGQDGNVVLSKRRADEEDAWKYLQQVHESGEPIEVPVTAEVKGGLIVDAGVRGFIPASHVSRGFVKDLKPFVGQRIKVRVIELDRPRNQVILSRKLILEEEQRRLREETWESIKEGEVRTGTVKRLTDFGAFVDLGGVDGLLHVSELSWGRVKHPSEVVHEGQEIKVKVLKVDRENERISLGHKQVLPDPWESIAERYVEGSIVTGKVVRLAPFGAFVELEPGIDGLVHISQLADRRVAKPEDVVEVGQEVKVKVLGVNTKAHRISLSAREAEEERDRAEYAAKAEPETGGGGLATLGDVYSDLLAGRKVEDKDKDKSE